LLVFFLFLRCFMCFLIFVYLLWNFVFISFVVAVSFFGLEKLQRVRTFRFLRRFIFFNCICFIAYLCNCCCLRLCVFVYKCSVQFGFDILIKCGWVICGYEINMQLVCIPCVNFLFLYVYVSLYKSAIQGHLQARNLQN